MSKELKIYNSSQAAGYLRDYMSGLDHEEMWAMFLNNASAVIILHNHPSGNPTPSESDIRETQKVHDACKLMDISLLDHIVISRDSFFSFADDRISKYQL